MGVRPGKCTWGNAATFAYDVFEGGCLQLSSVQAADRPAHSLWSQARTAYAVDLYAIHASSFFHSVSSMTKHFELSDAHNVCRRVHGNL